MKREKVANGLGQFVLITIATAICLVIELVTDEELEQEKIFEELFQIRTKCVPDGLVSVLGYAKIVKSTYLTHVFDVP